MPKIRRLLLPCSLALLSAVARAQTFPALAPLPGTGTLGTPADGSNFTFVVAGDNRPAKSGDPQPATLTAIVKAIQGMKPGTTGAGVPAFALWSGDQTGPFHRTDPAGVKPEYVISGGAGAPLTKKATPTTGGYHNYLVVQVQGADVTVTVAKVQ
jgi:hypothetical protein